MRKMQQEKPLYIGTETIFAADNHVFNWNNLILNFGKNWVNKIDQKPIS